MDRGHKRRNTRRRRLAREKQRQAPAWRQSAARVEGLQWSLWRSCYVSVSRRVISGQPNHNMTVISEAGSRLVARPALAV